MKALFVSNDLSIFDSTSETHRRLRSYADALGTLHVLSRAPRGEKGRAEGALILHPLQGSRFNLAKQARAIIASEGIELVSAQDPFEQGFAAMKAVEGTNVKLHVQVHTDFLSPWFVKGGGFRSPQVRVPFLNHIRRYLADQVLPRAAGIRTVSERVRASLVARYKDRIPEPSVIPIAVTGTLPPASALPPHDFAFALVTVSRIEPEKRIEDILYAIARIRFDYPSLGLFVIGTGSELPHLKRLAKKLGLSERVIFIDEWRSDVLALMQSAQAYIQASAYEGYGRTLVEAGLARLPIITTDVGIVGEVFTGYKDVLSAPIADPAALAVHIRGLVDDHQARMLLASEAKKTAEEHVARYADLPGLIARDLSETLQKA